MAAVATGVMAAIVIGGGAPALPEVDALALVTAGSNRQLRAAARFDPRKVDTLVARLWPEPVIQVEPTAPIESPPTTGVNWNAIAQCESGGDWAENAGTIYDGGLQFHPDTWLGYGGGQFASEAWMASPAQQIAIAERVLASQGPGAWPHCWYAQ